MGGLPEPPQHKVRKDEKSCNRGGGMKKVDHLREMSIPTEMLPLYVCLRYVMCVLAHSAVAPTHAR